MPDLVVRIYNVRFGDAVLVSIPEDDGGQTVTRHLLIDVGNVNAADAGGADAVFEQAVADIVAVTGGEVDLYVMTHEHLDHCQGLFWAKAKKAIDLRAKFAWLTRSADPDYYDHFEDARKELALATERYHHARAWFSLEEPSAWVAAMLENNNRFLPAAGDPSPIRTADCVDHLRTIAPSAKTYYVSRLSTVAGKHPFTEARLRILAPEADASIYYARRPAARLTTAEVEDTASPTTTPGPAPNPQPPAGVDAGAFFDLVASREQGITDDLLAIDKAANDTSIVLELEWRGWRLLFPGDAEEKSWDRMAGRDGLLRPVHFVKIGHHGSHNGTPDDPLLNLVLPETPPDPRKRVAALSTFDDTYNKVPDEIGDHNTLAAYRSRCDELVDTRTLADGDCFELRFPG